MPSANAALAVLERHLAGSALLGLELDLRYRVLAGTVDAAAARRTTSRGARTNGDVRLQLLWFPIGEFRAVLRRSVNGAPRVERFTPEQLVAVVDRLGEPQLIGPLFDQPPPPAETWQPEPSLHGRSDAADGRAHRVTLSVDGTEGEHLVVTATFDEIEVRRPDGTVIDPAALEAGS